MSEQMSKSEKIIAILAFTAMLGISIAELHLYPKIVQTFRHPIETLLGKNQKE